jgi:hypothetical protein
VGSLKNNQKHQEDSEEIHKIVAINNAWYKCQIFYEMSTIKHKERFSTCKMYVYCTIVNYLKILESIYLEPNISGRIRFVRHNHTLKSWGNWKTKV